VKVSCLSPTRVSPLLTADERAQPPLGNFGTHPFWVRFPVLQSFKEPGNWLASSEAAGP